MADNLLATWLLKSAKTHQYSMAIGIPSQGPFSNGFLDDFYCRLRPPKPSKLWAFLREKQGFCQKSIFEVDIRFRPDFDANLAPFLAPKTNPNQSKTDPKMHQKVDAFLLSFLIDLGFFQESSWVQFFIFLLHTLATTLQKGHQCWSLRPRDSKKCSGPVRELFSP